MRRRQFLAALLAAGTASGGAYLLRPQPLPLPPGEIVGGNHALGHRLRKQDFPAPTAERRVPCVIVGGGVAGLSAAWELTRRGMRDFEVLEMDREVGGNARGGRNEITAYPWGAHYLPFPPPEARSLRELLADLGVIQGDPHVQEPTYDERYICFAPQERLYLHGRWQEGLWPTHGVPTAERDQYRRFHDLIHGYRRFRDAEGRRGFAIPMAEGSPDPTLRALDRLSLRDLLLREGLDSPYLHWYVDYACRDDFGTHAADTSAWAGVHYFASREGEAAGVETDTVLVWPEGNAWLVERLRQRLAAHLHTDSLVYRVEENPTGVVLHIYHPQEGRSVRILAEHAIWAAPSFLLRQVHTHLPASVASALGEFEYASWLVANLTLREPPDEGQDAALAWDNVLFDSPSLGYVVADHQRLSRRDGGTVLTWFHALADGPPGVARRQLLATPWAEQAEAILRDLERPHPEIRALVTRLDLYRHGHAMVRPRVGFLWGEARQHLLAQRGRLHLAHSDLSGFSIFEEAHMRGVAAAQRVLEPGAAAPAGIGG
jgi:monoamine oxidase